MVKEPKNSDSSTNTASMTNESQSYSPTKNRQQRTTSNKPSSYGDQNVFVTLGNELRATLFSTQGYLKLDYFTLFWLFVGGSILGLGLETIYHAIVFGGFESRAGLVWGPFSPIYGTGAVALTIFLNRYYHSHNLVIFLVSMIVGSVIEYSASWGMEVFWGAIAWDYTDTFGSIQGRTNFFFGMMWGMLGLLWVRIILPIVQRIFSYFDSQGNIARILTIIVSLFMAVNIACTVMALARQNERTQHIPATNPIQMFLDETFPNSFMTARFENMTVGTENKPSEKHSRELLDSFL